MFFRSLLLVCFLLIVSKGYPQQKFSQGQAPVANAMDAEKIYLQFSGKAFNTSEVVWFKAIVTHAFDHVPSNISGVLHVELIEPLEKRIVDSKRLKLNQGIAESFFQLHGNYPEGKYLVRAYTEWSKNFGTDFIFSEYLDVFRFETPEDGEAPIRDITLTKEADKNRFLISAKIFPNELDSLHTGKALLYYNWKDQRDSIEIKQRKDEPFDLEHEVSTDADILAYRLSTENRTYSTSIVLNRDSGSLTFFPEGGTSVTGISSTHGFKYLDFKGRGELVEGVIIDQNDEQVAEFQSNSLGMGRIQFIPEQNKQYFGLITSKQGDTIKYPLPRAKSHGIAMRVVDRNTRKLLALDARPRSTDSVFVKLYHRGKNIYLLKGLLNEGEFTYAFENDILPNGIIGATVYDANYRPVAERHFYNYRPSEYLDVALEIDKSEYGLRDSVVVNVQTTKGKKPVASSVSVMAIDKAYHEKTNLAMRDIVSYFMLESDICGTIENPGYYFGDDPRLEDLDYLMLTQGWTNYKYDTPKKSKRIPPEKGLALTGTIGGVQNLKKKKRHEGETFDVVLMTFGENTELYHQQIDKTGYFRFDLEDSYGPGKKFVIQPMASARKTPDFKVNLKERKIPEIAYETEKVIVPVDTVIQKTVTDRIEKDIALDPYLLPNTIALDEVEVSDYLLTPEREAMKKLHGMPDVVIDNKELMAKKKNWTGTLYSWLLFNFPNELKIERVGGGSGFLYARVFGAGFTYIVIDGIPVQRDFFQIVPDIPLEAVKSVELLRNTSSANRYFREVFPFAPGSAAPPAFPAILAIYTYSGKGLFGAFPKKSSLLQASAPEFSPKREFYSPAYPIPEENSDIPDLRKLIFWKPDLGTDAFGKGSVTFYNGDIPGEVLIICEGIGLSGGETGRGEKAYRIIE